MVLDKRDLSRRRFTHFLRLELKIVSRVDRVIVFFHVSFQTVLFRLLDAGQRGREFLAEDGLDFFGASELILIAFSTYKKQTI